MILGAGLEGIKQGLDPGAPHTENMYTHSLDKLAKMGIKFLPRNLAEAIAAFASDPRARKSYGCCLLRFRW